MTSIILNTERIGAFTSSEVHRLMGIGKREMTQAELDARPKKGTGSRTTTVEDSDTPDDKFYTYVDEKRREKRIRRSIGTDVSTRATAWGELMEMMVHKRNGLEYRYTANKTTVHPTINGWAGSNDFLADDCVSEVKGYQPQKFTQYYECLEAQDVNKFRDEYPQEYWQIVSGAEIHGMKYGEAVLYMPYFSDLPKVYETAMNINTDGDIWRYKSICDAIEQERYAELPYLPDDSGYTDEIRFRFEVPEHDRIFIRKRIKLAVELLNQKP